MTKNHNPLKIKIYPGETQVKGSFDNGRITEIKPTSLPREGLKMDHLIKLAKFLAMPSKEKFVIMIL